MNVLIVDNSPIPYTLETPYVEPLGGSETAVTLLARGLSRLGNVVVILNNSVTRMNYENITVTHLAAYPVLVEQADVIIGSRVFLEETYGKPFIYWSHDAYDQVQLLSWMANPNAVAKVAQIWCVSAWQANTFTKLFGVSPEKLKVIGNPIDFSLYVTPTPKRNAFIYASIPYKGLPVLADLWRDIKLELQNEEAELWVFSSMKLYRREEEDKEYQDVLSSLARLPSVKVNPAVSMAELATYLRQARIYLHPSLYHETFGMVAVQAMAAECVPVVPAYGALPEVVQDGGYLLSCPNVTYPTCWDEMVETAVRAFVDWDKNVRIRTRGRRIASEYDFIKFACRVADLLSKLREEYYA